MKHFYTLLVILFGLHLSAQPKRVLFIGNSFTYVNDLPQMVADVATSAGDVLYHDMNAIGGAHLSDHFSNAVTIAKIQAGNWDYVVLQDQSESFFTPVSDPLTFQMTAAAKLDSVIKQYNPCAQTMFYITWGYKNGDGILCGMPDCIPPVLLTYDYFGMDSLIETNYLRAADSLKAMASPVGKIWRYVRRNDTTLEMYQADGMHPSIAGTYAAACTFYTAIFRKDPTLAVFNSALPTPDAALIKTAAKKFVFDSLLNWNIGRFDTLLSPGCLTQIPEINPAFSWEMYPNPVQSLLQVHVKNVGYDENIQVFNARGELVVSQIISQNDTPVNLGSLPGGLYFIRLKSQPAQIAKLVKQ